MIRFYIFVLFVTSSLSCASENISQNDLVGRWFPSGEMPREEGVKNYEFIVSKDLSAKYLALNDNGQDTNEKFSLNCDFKPSNSQDSVFVYYCYLKKMHLITLSLAGWNSESGSLLYGYEYWLGYPKPGKIHGGLPVSLQKER